MAFPTNDSFSGVSGKSMNVGRFSHLPAWLEGKLVGDWVEVPNSYGMDGNYVDPWCGFTVEQVTGDALVGLAGGHNDGFDTRMSRFRLAVDSPYWVSPRLKESVTQAESNFGFPYCDDGLTPSSRHTRYQFLHSPQRNGIVLIGSPSIYATNGSSVESNRFDLTTNTWDLPGTIASVAVASNFGQCIDDLGNIWARSQKWINETNTFVTVNHLNITDAYNPCCFDPVRRQVFQLCYGDGNGSSVFLGFTARCRQEFNYTNTGLKNITFNPSAAWDEFQVMKPTYAAMTYNKHLDVFHYYYGMGTYVKDVFTVKPNDTNVWDMTKIVTGPASVTPTLPPSAGINARLVYVEALRGVLLMPRQNSSLYFMRTS